VGGGGVWEGFGGDEGERVKSGGNKGGRPGGAIHPGGGRGAPGRESPGRGDHRSCWRPTWGTGSCGARVDQMGCRVVAASDILPP